MNTTTVSTTTPPPVSPPATFTATLKFPTRDAATKFAVQWSRATLRGHTVTSSGVVTLHQVTPTEKAWIDAYVETAAKR